jgi:hypothetical protein
MNLRDAIKEIARERKEVYSVVCRVTAVDLLKRTCTAAPINGDAPIYGIRLQALPSLETGFVAIPVVGSYVVATFLSEESAYIAVASEVEFIELTAPRIDLGGIEGQPVPKGEALNSNLERMIDRIADLCNHLAIFGNAQAAASTGPLAPLQPGYTQLAAAATALSTATNSIKLALNNHLSAKTYTE